MSGNSVAALRALLASSSVVGCVPWSAVDPGGTSFSVGAGGFATSLLALGRVRQLGGRDRFQSW